MKHVLVDTGWKCVPITRMVNGIFLIVSCARFIFRMQFTARTGFLNNLDFRGHTAFNVVFVIVAILGCLNADSKKFDDEEMSSDLGAKSIHKP
jgi:hypothetical protein